MSELEIAYRERFNRVLSPLAMSLETYIKECVQDLPRIDRVTARPKSVMRFLKKSEKMEGECRKYENSLIQIQDQVGARIVTFYLTDVPRIDEIVCRYFHPIEARLVIPDGEREFGYEGKHYILLIPTDVTAGLAVRDGVPECFELQIKTLFQHAWAEAEHDLAYKPFAQLSLLQRRKIAFTAAQAWGADQVFNDLFSELNEDRTADDTGASCLDSPEIGQGPEEL